MCPVGLGGLGGPGVQKGSEGLCSLKGSGDPEGL